MSCCPPAPGPSGNPKEQTKRVVAIDIHRGFGEVAVQEDGLVRSGGRVTLEHDAVLTFAETLSLEDHVSGIPSN